MNPNLPNNRMSDKHVRVAATKVIGSRVEQAAVISKLRYGNMPHHNQRGKANSLSSATSQADVNKISQEQQIRNIDNMNAVELMPEIRWACRVLCSSLLSPKDMTKRDLTYVMRLEWIPPDVRQQITNKISEEMENNYDYSDSLYPIAEDALFTRGSHPRMILPEAAVDRIINAGQELTFESIQPMFADAKKGTLKSRGHFGPMYMDERVALTMESFQRAMDTTDGSKFESDEQIKFKVMVKKEGEEAPVEEIRIIDEITITDNYDALKLPAYMDAVMNRRRHEANGLPGVKDGTFDDLFGDMPTVSNESMMGGMGGTEDLSKNAKIDMKEFKAATYKTAPTNMVTHLSIPGVSALPRRSVGRPLVQSLPSEAVIPIHAPGDPRRHLGYIILLDDTGYPITLNGSEQFMNRANAMFNAANATNSVGKDSMGSMILSKAARNLSPGKEVTNIQEINKIVEKIIEENVLNRMLHGAYPGGAEIAEATDIYGLMVARMLCSMRTRIVFVPAEMITYFAFDYHTNGMGRSLLDTNKALIAMRAGLLLSRMTGEMRNSIPLTEVLMKIDPRDPDPEARIEEALDLLSKTRQPQFPLSTLSINDIGDWINRAGYVIKFAEHPRLPDTGFEFTKTNHENKLPDQEFYDSIGKQIYMGFGIPPELMDTAYDPEFAVAVANRNIIFAQTILEYQKKFSGLISDDVRRLASSDGIIVQGIAEIIKSKWGEITANLPDEEKDLFNHNPRKYAMELVQRCIDSIYVTLPSPDTTTLEGQREQFRLYAEFIDEALDYIVSDSVIAADYGPELVGRISVMKGPIKAALMREYMADNSILPELGKLTARTEDGKPAFDLLDKTSDLLQGLAINILSFAKKIAPLDVAVGKDAEALKMGTSGEAAVGGSGGLGGGGSTGSSDFGATGFDMDFGFGSDDAGGGGGDTTAAPDTPSE